MALDEADGNAPYRKPRVAAGLGLLVLVGFLYVVNRPPEPIALGLFLGTSLLFLGVEGAKLLLRG